MRRKDIIWLILFVLAILLVSAENYLPYLPGDIIATKLVQSFLPESKGWAKWISSTAGIPWVLVLGAIIFPLCWATLMILFL